MSKSASASTSKSATTSSGKAESTPKFQKRTKIRVPLTNEHIHKRLNFTDRQNPLRQFGFDDDGYGPSGMSPNDEEYQQPPNAEEYEDDEEEQQEEQQPDEGGANDDDDDNDKKMEEQNENDENENDENENDENDIDIDDIDIDDNDENNNEENENDENENNENENNGDQCMYKHHYAYHIFLFFLLLYTDDYFLWKKLEQIVCRAGEKNYDKFPHKWEIDDKCGFLYGVIMMLFFDRHKKVGLHLQDLLDLVSHLSGKGRVFVPIKIMDSCANDVVTENAELRPYECDGYIYDEIQNNDDDKNLKPENDEETESDKDKSIEVMDDEQNKQIQIGRMKRKKKQQERMGQRRHERREQQLNDDYDDDDDETTNNSKKKPRLQSNANLLMPLDITLLGATSMPTLSPGPTSSFMRSSGSTSLITTSSGATSSGSTSSASTSTYHIEKIYKKDAYKKIDDLKKTDDIKEEKYDENSNWLTGVSPPMVLQYLTTEKRRNLYIVPTINNHNTTRKRSKWNDKIQTNKQFDDFFSNDMNKMHWILNNTKYDHNRAKQTLNDLVTSLGGEKTRSLADIVLSSLAYQDAITRKTWMDQVAKTLLNDYISGRKKQKFNIGGFTLRKGVKIGNYIVTKRMKLAGFEVLFCMICFDIVYNNLFGIICFVIVYHHLFVYIFCTYI